MREYPILFSAPMIRALLEGRKTVTRRMSQQWLKVNEGDRLWVREAFCVGYPTGEPHHWSALRPTNYQGNGRAFYRADGKDAPSEPQRTWKPSIHMPRWASRITLEATEDAWDERLWDLTEQEALNEGMIPDGTEAVQFVNLWRQLHTKPGERWEDNPEVVRIAFKVI